MSLGQRVSEGRALLGILHGSRAFGGPIQASLWLTGRCNVRCIHCYYHSPLVRTPNLPEVRRARRRREAGPGADERARFAPIDADRDRTRALLEELKALGTRRFLFTGSGEVFLNPDALALMGLAKRDGSYCVANTNGTLLDGATTRALIDMGFDELHVTTMAGSPEAYGRTHPGARRNLFESLEANLRELAERKAANGARKPRVDLVCIVIRENASSLFEFAEFAVRVGADQVSYRPVDDVGDEGLARLVPSPEEAQAVRRELGEVRRFLDARGVAHNLELFGKVFGTKLDTRALYRIVPCYYGWISVLCTVDGQVLPCCRCYEPLGNWLGTSFAEIWHGPAYSRFRRAALALPRRRTAVEGCDCHSCVQYPANVRIYRALHPLASRSPRLVRLTPSLAADEG